MRFASLLLIAAAGMLAGCTIPSGTGPAGPSVTVSGNVTTITSGTRTLRITNSSSAACSGMQVTGAGPASRQGVAWALYLEVENSSGQRRWLQADVKYYTELNTFFGREAGEHWETTRQLIMRADETLAYFPVKQLAGPNDPTRIVEVNVLACGG